MNAVLQIGWTLKRGTKMLVDKIIAYETGEASDDETLDLFAELIKNGMVRTLQGCYGRTAIRLIEAGYISESGEKL